MKNKTSILIVASVAFVAIVVISFAMTSDVFRDAPDPDAPTDQVAVELVADGFVSPVGYVSADDGTGRMFVVDQVGLVEIVDDEGNLIEGSFLDIRERIVNLSPGYDERGLLGLAFHPNFDMNGRFFVHYSAPLREGAPEGWDHTSVISEFSVDEDNPNVADPNSERIMITFDQPQSNHNGGHIVFGPDGSLYIPLGDGGGSGDEGLGHPDMGNGQDISTPLGSILRIDVNQEGSYSVPLDNPFVDDEEGLDEIFAYGFRNPYHISFDRGGDNELFVADVGEDLWEEVNIVRAGGNYGWNIREGTHCFDPDDPTDPPDECPTIGARGEDLIDPIFEYRNARHDGLGVAIVGGYVYRGEILTGLEGDYVFADWSRGFEGGDGSVFAATLEDNEWSMRELSVSNGNDEGRLGLFIKGVGEDADGELYLLATENSGPSGNTGRIYRIVDFDEPDDEPDEVTIRMEDNAFDPEVVTVSEGTEVRWINEGAEIHTVTSEGNFDSGNVEAGETFIHTFDQSGTFDYICTLHPGMEGTVVVE